MVKLAIFGNLRLSVGSCCICAVRKSNLANFVVCSCNVSSNAALACSTFWPARVFARIACSTAREALLTASCILLVCIPAIGTVTKDLVGNSPIGDITGAWVGVVSGCFVWLP